MYSNSEPFAVPYFGPSIVEGNNDAIEFRNLSFFGPDNFAMVTLQLANTKALKTVRTRRLSFSGKKLY